MNAGIKALAIFLGIVGCTPLAPPLHPTRSVVQVRDVVRVSLTQIDNDALDFTVWNNGTQPIQVYGEAVVLDTDHGPRKGRTSGSSFTLTPGARHALNVRFDWTGLRNTTARVLFDNAIRVGGTPVDVSAIEIRVE